MLDQRYYCFGCHATGDVIDFTARLFGISQKSAALKLAQDFGINPRPPIQSDIPQYNAEPFRKPEQLCIRVLREYLRLLRIWKVRHRPAVPGDPLDERFVGSCQMEATITDLIDALMDVDVVLMVKKYPDFERGESASETGRTHIPPRLFKEAVRLNRQKDKLAQLLSEITPLNAKKKSTEMEAILDDYIPSVEKLMTRMKKAGNTVKELKKEIAVLEREVDGSKASVQQQLELIKKLQEFEALQQTVNELEDEIAAIPSKIREKYKSKTERKDTIIRE